MPIAPRLLKILAWLLLVALAIVTVGPIGLRPETPLPTGLERALGLFIVGFVFALAYPRKILLVALLLLTSTAVFEALQTLEPYRHGRILDLLVKLTGGGIGLFLGWFAARRRDR